MTIAFDNSYARLPGRFYARLAPTPVSRPEPIAINRELAQELGLDTAELESAEGIAMLAGNLVPAGAEPLAQAYAGHQFGNFVPQLGDGRAILLGEVVDRAGRRRDIQLKGSGPTPFSRAGDGRAWLGPVLREYVVSEAMHAMGVPTTRALAAIATGDTVYRGSALPGAILTRVAGSHVRVGTFQFFAARRDVEALQELFDHVVARHAPDAQSPLELLAAVIERQATLVAKWMGVGFIHGVMNTDNVNVAGETIDYGPCAFLDTYDPAQVYSSIDRFGRYAYGRQPEIMTWNLAQFASALLPLIDDDEEQAVASATEVMATASPAMQSAWLAEFRRKLGLEEVGAAEIDAAELATRDTALIGRLLQLMYEGRADFTNTFRALPDVGAAKRHFRKLTADADRELSRLAEDWAQRLQLQGEDLASVRSRLATVNPSVIPRNHRVEEAIQAGLEGDYSVFERLVAACTQPFADRADGDRLTLPPEPHEVVERTFCGT
ncbi:MAG: YdiU family protein [bacterium]|nr:YdiU family protein [bacterium]